MNFLKLLLIAGMIIISIGLKAKPTKRTNNFTSYKDPLNEIGYGIDAAYLKSDNLLVPLLQVNYSRYLTSYFSIGVNYCGIYSQNIQNSVSLKISFTILNNLVISLKPGFIIKNQFDQSRLLYFLGIEPSYQFKLSDRVGMGPMLDFNFIQDDFYLIGGFKMGFYF